VAQNAQDEGTGAEGSSRVVLRPLAAGDRDEFLELARASVSLHHPWYTLPTTADEFRVYLQRFSRPETEARWAITAEMTGFPPADPHPTRPAR
jgi:hypothetical protein